MEPKTLKGFRDFLPDEARKRLKVIEILRKTFEFFDFQPLETPALEYEEILAGKYGDEGEKLMYKFEDHGNRKVALRYDQTVPLARVVAQYQNDLPMPFMRYQIQPVWRGENTQRGRYREFLQCDADIVGTASARADAQIIIVAVTGLYRLGFRKFTVLINDRALLTSLSKETITAIDKIKKIGKDAAIEEIQTKSGLTKEEVEKIISSLENAEQTERIKEIFSALDIYKASGQIPEVTFQFSPTLARGLDYYTGLIFEIELEGFTEGSICGGGRYDNLIGMFAGRDIPAVGFAYGFDRIMDAIEQFNISLNLNAITEVLVTVFSQELQLKAMELTNLLRSNGISTELYLGDDLKIEKQLKYADKKQIPYVIIIGPEEAEKNVMQLKNMQTREQKTTTIEETIEILKKSIDVK